MPVLLGLGWLEWIWLINGGGGSNGGRARRPSTRAAVQPDGDQAPTGEDESDDDRSPSASSGAAVPPASGQAGPAAEGDIDQPTAGETGQPGTDDSGEPDDQASRPRTNDPHRPTGAEVPRRLLYIAVFVFVFVFVFTVVGNVLVVGDGLVTWIGAGMLGLGAAFGVAPEVVRAWEEARRHNPGVPEPAGVKPGSRKPWRPIAALRRWLRAHAPVAVSAVAVIAVTATAIGLLVGPRRPALPLWVGCAPPTQLRVLTSADGLESTKEVAADYEKGTARGNGGCPAVDLYVFAPESAGVTWKDLAAALANGWRDDARIHPLRDIGPRPDVWLAASTLDAEEVEGIAEKALNPAPIADASSVAMSPVVLGIMAPAGSEFGNRPTMSWAGWLAEIERRNWDVLRPDPATSVTGRVATAALYASEQHVDAAGHDQFRVTEQRITSSLDHGGYRRDAPSAGLLCQLRHKAGSVGAGLAVVSSEHALARFSAGLPLSPECAQEVPRGPEMPLFVYPSDTFWLDHPFVRLTWTTEDRPRRAVAAFRDWLRSIPGRESLRDAGLRPVDPYPIEPPLVDRLRRLPPTSDLPSSLPPTTADASNALDAHRAAQAAGRVLLAVDASGSMRQQVGGAAETRLQVVARGVRESLDHMGSRDEFGVWVFPGPGGTRHQELVPIGPGQEDRRRQVVGRLAGVRAAGGTPLYDTIVQAVGAAGQRAGRPTVAVVVLTDGEDSTGRTPSQVRAALAKSRVPVQVFVVAVGQARCGDGPLRAIRGLRCDNADISNIEGKLAELFSVLWRGQ
jgi:Bacterial extracellular solute-binding protein